MEIIHQRPAGWPTVVGGGGNALPCGTRAVPARPPAAPLSTAVRPRPNKASAAAPPQTGDCFVVVNCRGQCWDGATWVDRWDKALQFRRPSSAYELCDSAAREAERMTGVAGMVSYIPPGTPPVSLAPFPDLSQVDLRDFALKPEVC